MNEQFEEITPDELECAKSYVRQTFKQRNGEPFELTDTQAKIFSIISQRRYPRVEILSATQYGKSQVVALAILTRASTFPEQWCIVAGSEAKAKIIMRYVIQHCYDDESISSKLQYDPESAQADRLQREKSKSRITFRHHDGTMGEIFILSGDSRIKSGDAGDIVMGFGAANVVLDEAALINNIIEAKIFRMLAGHPDSFYCKIGNPFRRNHFYTDWKNPRFYKIFVDYMIGLIEKRYTPDFIQEAKEKPLFDILFECKFPAAEDIDDSGYMPLFLDEDLKFISDSTAFKFDYMGIDPSGEGQNLSVWSLRNNYVAKISCTEEKSNEKSIAAKTALIKEKYKMYNFQIYVDDFGDVGAKVPAEIMTSSRNTDKTVVNGVNAGVKGNLFKKKYCRNKFEFKKYFNLKALLYFRFRDWVKRGGQFIDFPGLKGQLLSIKYKVDASSGQIKIMSKRDMKIAFEESPDQAESLIQTFAGANQEEIGTPFEIPNELSYKYIMDRVNSKRHEEAETVEDFI